MLTKAAILVILLASTAAALTPNWNCTETGLEITGQKILIDFELTPNCTGDITITADTIILAKTGSIKTNPGIDASLKEAIVNCETDNEPTIIGLPGTRGGDLILQGKTIQILGEIILGNGGHGQSIIARASGDCDEVTIFGGDGGRSGQIIGFISHPHKLLGGHGGDGGNAILTSNSQSSRENTSRGQNGTDIIAPDGESATATDQDEKARGPGEVGTNTNAFGGNGGIGVQIGGRGGDASAHSSNGTDGRNMATNEQDPTRGGDGGQARAIAGFGGRGAIGGQGGHAYAYGGHGGHGGTISTLERRDTTRHLQSAGEGAFGGTATAQGGYGGPGTERHGNGGNATAVIGNSGNGGHSLNPDYAGGRGGKAAFGHATAGRAGNAGALLALVGGNGAHAHLTLGKPGDGGHACKIPGQAGGFTNIPSTAEGTEGGVGVVGGTGGSQTVISAIEAWPGELLNCPAQESEIATTNQTTPTDSPATHSEKAAPGATIPLLLAVLIASSWRRKHQ